MSEELKSIVISAVVAALTSFFFRWVESLLNRNEKMREYRYIELNKLFDKSLQTGGVYVVVEENTNEPNMRKMKMLLSDKYLDQINIAKLALNMIDKHIREQLDLQLSTLTEKNSKWADLQSETIKWHVSKRAGTKEYMAENEKAFRELWSATNEFIECLQKSIQEQLRLLLNSK